MAAYYYSSVAGTYTLTTTVSPSATALVLDSVAGLPSSVPYKVVLNPGEYNEEIVKVTAIAGMSLTVVRGWNGTAAVDHAAGATVRHMVTAEDLTLSRTHEDATVAHGATGAVVGTTNAQTLTNKDLTTGNTFPSTLATTTTTQALTNKDLTAATNSFPSTLVTLDGIQTVINKDLSASTNTFPASLARTAGQAFTGPISATTGTFSGAVTGNNLPAVKSAKAGKRFDWANFTGTTNATGLVTFTHSLGYIPSVIVCSAENSIGIPKGFEAYNVTTSTITARFYTNETGSSYANSFVTADFFFGE